MNYSNCKWCGSRLPEKAKKCESCGKPVEFAADPVSRPASNSTPSPKRASGKSSSVTRSGRRQEHSLGSSVARKIVGVFALMMILFAASFYLKYIRQKEASETSPTHQPVTSEPVRFPEKELKSPDPTVRIGACEILNRIKPPSSEVVKALIQTLKDPERNVRAICSHFVGELGYLGADAVPLLIVNLKDDALNVRISSADALAAIASQLSEDTRAIQPLMDAMNDPDPLVRRSACWALKGLGIRAESALPAFQKGATDSSIDVQKCSMDAIADLSQSNINVAPFVTALQSNEADVRRTAAEALSKAGAGARRAIPDLARLLNDPDEWVREAAVEALGKCCIETGETVPLLNKALLDPSHSVRKHAVLHLGEIGPRAKMAVPNLIRILSGQEIYLRVWAAEALGNIGPDAASALPRLHEMKNEKIESYEIEAAQLPGAIDTAIRKIQKI